VFTGIVEELGEVVSVETRGDSAVVAVRGRVAADARHGDSIAVNGVCLTVVDVDGETFRADVMAETLKRSSLADLAPGDRVNLERPLRADGRLGGHFVQGHVDAVGHIEELRAEADFHWMAVRFPAALAPLLVPKGSIAVDGISLTVAAVDAGRFDVMVVPFTLAHTNLGRAEAGDRVNLEGDMVGKYVVRAAELAGLGLTRVRPGEVTH
jgi:riboflavin synthase